MRPTKGQELNDRDLSQKNRDTAAEGNEQTAPTPETGEAPEADEQPEEEEEPGTNDEQEGLKDSRDLQDIE